MNHLLELKLLIKQVLDVLAHKVDALTFSFALCPELEERLVFLRSGHATNRAKHFRILSQPLRVFQVFHALSRPDTIPGAQLLVLVIILTLRDGELLDVRSNVSNSPDQIHVVSHDLQVVCLVDLAFNLETLLQRVHRVFEELLLVLVLKLDAWVHVAVLSPLVCNKVVQTLVDSNL